MSSAEPTRRLSKSRFLLGLQCQKLLWWTVHEPDAPELNADDGDTVALDRGIRVGELARQHVPGGVLIDVPYDQFQQRITSTAEAIQQGAKVVYEASFVSGGVFVSVDILERRKSGFVVTEVKSTTSVKEQHLPDVAVQAHVVRGAGFDVKRLEVMHLNRQCRHPELSKLFVREDVTAFTKKLVRAMPSEVDRMHATLSGSLPDVEVGAHCNEPYPCPFQARCWPAVPEHHVSTLYRIRSKKAQKLVADGYQTLSDLPAKFKASAPARRQIKSVKRGELIVERGLGRALDKLKTPMAFLDFETLTPAIPLWSGCRPYDQVPVQLSCHVLEDGKLTHREWLADGPNDPREAFARALLEACGAAKTIVAYNAPFERRCIEELAELLPEHAAELKALAKRLRDLLPIVRDHVYHPDFGGSFSLKAVLPALVPGLGYDDLEIRDGGSASSKLETLLLDGTELASREKATLRRQLLQYCERDTLAMVRLFERLRELAA